MISKMDVYRYSQYTLHFYYVRYFFTDAVKNSQCNCGDTVAYKSKQRNLKRSSIRVDQEIQSVVTSVNELHIFRKSKLVWRVITAITRRQFFLFGIPTLVYNDIVLRGQQQRSNDFLFRDPNGPRRKKSLCSWKIFGNVSIAGWLVYKFRMFDQNSKKDERIFIRRRIAHSFSYRT